MNEIIKISEVNGKQAVSAKELHLFVDMLTRFDIWISRMLEYGFTENVDYQCLYKNVPMPNGGEKKAIDG
ncbi:MAG: antA/AntB antirepressor family protein [Lutibacter sp.]|jgi:anti-repressor protein